MANGGGEDILSALLLGGLSGADRPAVARSPGVTSPTLTLLQNLRETSPVFEPGRRVGGLGQVGRALGPATEAVVEAPLRAAQAEQARSAAILDAVKEGLTLRKMQLEIGDLESAQATDAAIVELLGGPQAQGEKITLKGKRATLERKGPPFKSGLAEAVGGIGAGLNRLITSFRVNEDGTLAFQTTPSQQTSLQAQQEALTNVKSLTAQLKEAVREDATTVGFTGSLQRFGFGALSQVRNIADLARRNAISAVEQFGVDETVSSELLDTLFNPNAEAVDVLQTALAFQVAAGLFNQQGREITNKKLELANKVIGAGGPLANAQSAIKRLEIIEKMTAETSARVSRRLQPQAPTGVGGAFAGPRVDAASRARTLAKSLPGDLSGPGRAQAIFSILQSEGYSLEELRALGAE